MTTNLGDRTISVVQDVTYGTVNFVFSIYSVELEIHTDS